MPTLVPVGTTTQVLGFLTGVGKTILNLRERNFIKQTATFANSFNSGNLDAKNYQEYKEKLTDDSSFGEKELGRIMLLLETTFDEERSALLGKMYAAYVNKDINWKDFCEISDAVSRMFVPDIELLFEINAKRISDTTQCKSYQAERLQSLGLVRMSMKSIMVSSGRTHATDSYLSCSALGASLCANALRHGYEFGLNR